MSERYGHRWIALNGEHWDRAVKPWAMDLHDLTVDEFATGLRADLARDSDYPPGSKDFRRMAISERRSTEPAHQLLAPPDIEYASDATANAWRAYQETYGLRARTMSDDERTVALEGWDMVLMREEVRSMMRETAKARDRTPIGKAIYGLARRWPWHASEGGGIKSGSGTR